MTRANATRGYTLVEVVLASAILAVVLLGAQSAVVIASRALPNANSGPGAVLAAEGALGSLADDLACAATIAGMTATKLEFTVPDMTGDSAEETIRYEWSGVAGEPLTRTFNGGTAVTVAKGVRELVFTYETTDAAVPTTYSESAEAALFTFAPTGTMSAGSVTTGKWWAQYFEPVLPSDAVSWTVTRVVMQAVRKSGTTGQAKAQLRPDAARSPGAQVLSEVKVLESGLGGSFGDAQMMYTYASGLSPRQGVWFVLEWVSDTEAFEIQYKTAAGLGTSSPLMTSANGGGSWSTLANSQMLLTVYGKVLAPETAKTATVLSAVRCRLRAGDPASTGLSQTIRVLTGPKTP